MSNLTKAQRSVIVANHLKTAQGRSILAGSMNKPLRQFRDYVSVARRAFVIDSLPDGALPYYDKDVDVVAYVLGEEGEDVLIVVKGERVFVPLFEVATLVEIPITQIKHRRYDIQTRVKEKTKSEIIRAEDLKIFGMFSRICNASGHYNPPILVNVEDVTIDEFSEAIGQIERHGDINCTNIFLNPVWNTILRKINKDYYIDFETSKTIMKMGTIGTLYGATIHASSQIPENEIYFTGEAEFFGVVVESQPLSSISADNPAKRRIGFSVFEEVGVLVHNSKAISMVKISS